jgi:hypothetical protein
MKTLLLSLCWLPLVAGAQPAFSGLHRPHLAGYYDGTINGTLAVQAYFFPVDFTKEVMLNGTYHYGQRQRELTLAGAFFEPDSLVMEEYTTPDLQFGTRTGHLRLQFQPDGTLRGSWRAENGRARLPVALHPVAGPALATCAPVRVVQRTHRALPTLATADAQAANTFAREVAAEQALNEADPGTEAYTVTYAGHNLVSLALSSEMQGASVTTGYRWATFDACTGHKLAAAAEVAPSRQAFFMEAATRHLIEQVEDYIARRGPHGSEDQLLSDDDVTGLRGQRFELDPEEFKLEDGQVVFPHHVSYEGLPSFIAKEYAGQFGAAFSFEELQSFLRPASPLCRLVLPAPARAAAPAKPLRRPSSRPPRK